MRQRKQNPRDNKAMRKALSRKRNPEKAKLADRGYKKVMRLMQRVLGE